jgi:two-component system NtrC family response regulator
MTGILIVDDEPHIRSGLKRGLSQEADEIHTAGSVNEALDLLGRLDIQVVIADVRLPGDRDGLDLVSILGERYPEVTAVVITAHGTVETAVEAMRRGAFDFITKPVDLNLIRQQIRRAFSHGQLRQENSNLRLRLADAGEIAGIIGQSTVMQELFGQIRQIADTDATVMIRGESGTGKELIARALHDLSPRSEQRFVAVNLGAMPETLLESELFGHEKGAFTGASRQKAGCFELAARGTLFLDEITEIPAKSQVDLLRVLETGEFCRIGGETPIDSSARIVSATNRDPQALVEDGTFREDLFYRLNIIPIFIPPLRERPDDIPLLATHFIQHFSQRHHRPIKQLTDQAVDVLTGARWPGNVRQLRNVMERLVVTHVRDQIDVDDLPAELTATKAGRPRNEVETLADATARAEKGAIEAALQSVDFHREQAAKRLGVSVRTLHYKMSRYGLH